MPDLIARSLPLVPLTLLPALLLLLAPLVGRRGRTLAAVVLATLALGFVVDLLLFDHDHTNELAVPNAFPRAPEGEPFVWRTEVVRAPASYYHLWLAVMLALPAAVLFARRNRNPRPPDPILHGTGVFLYYLALRLGLEKTAAPEPVVWATGGTLALLLILPFFGWYCGARGRGYGGFVGRLLLLGLAQRVPLIAIAGVATLQHLGTHLDTHVVEDIWLFGSDRRLDSDLERWMVPTVIPHLTVWIVTTWIAGVVLGSVPFWIARRRSAADQRV